MADEEVFNVLIVDDQEETRKNVARLLQFENDINVVGTARTGQDAIKQTLEHDPDVVLMDINMPDMDGIEATEQIQEQAPISQIVILSVQGDVNYMRRAMGAGARDFLTKPPKSDELISVIRRAGSMAKAMREREGAYFGRGTGTLQDPRGGTHQLAGLGRVVAVFSPKGGVGTTTIATNLAVALHSPETPAVIVDANLQFGDVQVFLNERGRTSIIDLTPNADHLDRELVEDVVLHHKTSGIDIVSAPPHPEDAERITGSEMVKVLQFLARLYTYVIVDTDSSLSDVTLDTLDNCDLLVMVSSQDIPAIINTRSMFNLLGTLGVDKNKILLVMNRFDKTISITPDKVGHNLGHKVATVLVEDKESVVPGVNRGVPFMLGDGKGKEVGKGILELVGKVRESISKMEQPEFSEN
jgi:pilus assembly protein CpaE